MDILLLTLFSSLLVSTISFSGAVFLIKKKFFQNRHLPTLVSFAAGVMLTAAFADLLPEALEASSQSEQLFLPMFVGIVLFFILERFVVWFHHHHDDHGKKPTAILVLIGDGIHNVLDGVAIAAAYLVNPALGITTTIAICAHEIPQEIADLSILIESGFSKKKALLYNFLSGLSALVGAVIGLYFL